MKRFWVCGVIVLAWAIAILGIVRAEGSITDCIDATCRVTAGNGKGSGCAYERSKGYVYVLTAAHVVGQEQNVTCEFWRAGHRSRPLGGTVVQRSTNADAAVIAIPEASFEGVIPCVIPVAPRDYVVEPGSTLTSVGCAKGAWSTGWKGHALTSRGEDLYFVPTPANGRSGSAIFNADGTMIVGLLRARMEDQGGSKGIATSLKTLYTGFNSQTQVQAPCPPGGCQTPWRALPYRHEQDEYNRSQDERIKKAWPTLPAQAAPAGPACDLSPLVAKLDRIVELLQPAPDPVLPPDESGLELFRGETSERFDDVYSQLATIKEGMAGLAGVAHDLNEEDESLKGRFAAAKAEAVEAGKSGLAASAAAAKDVVVSKLMTFGAIPGGILLVILIIVLRDIYQKIKDGDPLIVEKVARRVKRRVRRVRARVAGDDPDEVEEVIEEEV